MSFQTFTTFSFREERANWQVSLSVDGGSSASNTTPVTAMVRRVGDKQLNPLEPILKATLDLSLYDKGRVVSSRIRNNLHRDIRVTVKRDGTVWHDGILQSVNGGDVIRYNNPSLQLTFDDGTGRLKSRAGLPSKSTLLNGIDADLDASGLELPVRVALAFNDQDQDLTIPRAQGQQIDEEYLTRQGTLYEGLERKLRYYNLQLFQEDGKWRCLQRSYRDSGQSYTYSERDGVSITTGTRNPTNSLTDADWLAPAGANTSKSSLVRSIIVPAVGWARSKTRRERSLSFSLDLNAGGSISQLETWSTVPAADDSQDDQFNFKLEGTAEINDTNETGTFDAEIARLIAFDPGFGSKYYWDRPNQTWTTTKKQISVTLDEQTSGISTDSFSLTENITELPGFGGWIVQVELISPSTDPDGDGLNELDSVSVDKALLEDFERKADSDVRPTDELTLRTNGSGDQISEQLGVITTTAGGSTWPNGGLYYKDSTSGDFVLQGGPDAEHATRSLGSSNVDLDNLRLRDRLSQTSSSMRRIEGLVRSTAVKLNDTIQYDGSDFLLVYSKHRVGKGVKEVAALELLNEPLPPNPVIVNESS